MTRIPFGDYRAKVMGCWLGKAVGGTLGGPVEGRPGPLSLVYYAPVPDRMLPNDDLDLQVALLETIRRRGLPIDRRLLAGAWLDHIRLLPDEYGVAVTNLSRGIWPPASGAYDNGFVAGMGAAIRTELWACLAPGDPALAAAFAREDACVDHSGEGIHAAVFLASLESAAFIESDRDALLDLAQATIPSDSRVARAVGHTRRWWEETRDWREVRERVLAAHGRQNFTDVAQNLAFVVLGWLAGEDDFGESICSAVNCGADTDCIGATLGALLGILDPGSISVEWLRPIGRELVLSPGMVSVRYPATLDDFTDEVAALAVETLRYYRSSVMLDDVPPDVAPAPAPRLRSPELVALPPEMSESAALVATDPLVVSLVYPPGTAFVPEVEATLGVTIANALSRRIAIGLAIDAPEGWTVANPTERFVLAPGERMEIAVKVRPPESPVRPAANSLDLRFRARGIRWTVSAELPLATPWLAWPGVMVEDCPIPPPNAERIEVAGRSVPLSDGRQSFVAEFKLPYAKAYRYVVQAPRALHAWIDGNLLVHHDGSYRVPAVHRPGATFGDVRLCAGWHRITVAVEDGIGGDLWVVIGDGESWELARDIEWRAPESA